MSFSAIGCLIWKWEHINYVTLSSLCIFSCYNESLSFIAILFVRLGRTISRRCYTSHWSSSCSCRTLEWDFIQWLGCKLIKSILQNVLCLLYVWLFIGSTLVSYNYLLGRFTYDFTVFFGISNTPYLPLFA